MKTPYYNVKDLETLLSKQKVATMGELKAALKTEVDITVFRKLKQLESITSYSHRGRYYSLKRLARFDENGIWAVEGVRFSDRGTLVATVESLAQNCEAGCYAAELEDLLQVGVGETLLRLLRKGRVSRERISNRFLYCSILAGEKRQQIASRRAAESESLHGRLPVGIIHNELKAAIVLFYCLLDEQQRRLFAGLESLKWGHGGDRRVADILSVDVGTVAKGRRQLLAQDVQTQRARKTGGVRKAVEKKRRKSSQGSKN
jgi:hypothetical protein